MNRRRIAIIGCGAVTRMFHLPASQLVPDVEVVALVDVNQAAASALAAQYGVPAVVEDYKDLVGLADLVLVATPPQSHVEIISTLLAQGMNVLCEKPLGRTAVECEQMLAAERAGGSLLLAAHNRRLFPNRRLLKTLLETRALGEIQEISLTSGGEFNWPTATGYMFDQQATGGGVLIDSGIHELDTLLWYWPDLQVEHYADDALGAVESNIALHFTVLGGVPGVLRLSRTSPLPNRLRIRGALGTAELVTHQTGSLVLNTVGSPLPGAPWTVETPTPLRLIETFALQITHAFLAVEGKQPPLVTGLDALRVSQIIDPCYAQKRKLAPPTLAPLTGVPE